MRRAAAAALLALLPACGVHGLNFVQDDRVTIEAPPDRSEVTLPVTIRWQAEDFDGTFAVFVDRAPMPPGRSVEWLARDDELCAETPGCPDERWLADRYVFVTDQTQLTLDRLPERARDARQDHEAVIVLLDEDGRRAGESAFTVQFEVDDGG